MYFNEFKVLFYTPLLPVTCPSNHNPNSIVAGRSYLYRGTCTEKTFSFYKITKVSPSWALGLNRCCCILNIYHTIKCQNVLISSTLNVRQADIDWQLIETSFNFYIMFIILLIKDNLILHNVIFNLKKKKKKIFISYISYTIYNNNIIQRTP